MGLDVVELVLECEAQFQVKLEDWKLERMTTVGDLFELICEELKLAHGPDAPRPKQLVPVLLKAIPIGGWDRETVWARLVSIVVNQLRVDENEVRYAADFGRDLGAD